MPREKERVVKVCDGCGNEFKVLPSREFIKYCSSKCRNEARSKSSKGKYYRNSGGVKVKCICINCDEEFYLPEYKLKNGNGKYCSRKCKDEDHKKTVKLSCSHCGQEFQTVPSQINDSGNNFCSKACANKFFFSGEKHWKWNGGKKILKGGYVGIMAKDHPCADDQGYYEEHRLVMENHLGRILESIEIVHHINEVKDDNRIENLMLFANNKLHMEHHAKLNSQR